MAHAVSLVMIDIVKSRTIQRRMWEIVGDKADRRYTEEIKTPCRERVLGLLDSHHGRLHDEAGGDQFATYFDHAQDAVRFALALQRLMSFEPIGVPEDCDCPHLQLHIAIGRGTMEAEAYQRSGAVCVGAFSDLARILNITANDQILITEEALKAAGKIPDISQHRWEVILPKEEDKMTVIELLSDGREPRRPKDKAASSAYAAQVAEDAKVIALISDQRAVSAPPAASPHASPPAKPKIREKAAAEVLRNLEGIEPSYKFNEKVKDLYLGRWTQEPGWKATVADLPTRLSGGRWLCSFKEVGSDTLIIASTAQDSSTLRPGDSVTVSGRIADISVLKYVALEDATISATGT